MDFKIEAGKFYKTGDNRKVIIYATDRGDFFGSIHGAVLYTMKDKECWKVVAWDKNGNVEVDDKHHYDIVAPWVDEPIVPWDRLPHYIKFVAMDSNYVWFGYVERPISDGIGLFMYERRRGFYELQLFKLLEEHRPIYNGDWKDSLVKRPEGV